MLPLDVRSDESVKTCVDAVIEQTGHLDILINNAGYVLAGAIEEITLEQAKDQFNTNFFGVMRMVKAVLPIMRGQGKGQIINISSLAALNPVPFWGLYNASKFALEGYTDSLRHELMPFNIHVSLVEPGFFKSQLGKSTQVGHDQISDYDGSRQRVFERIREEEEGGSDPRIVAETVLSITENKSPRLRHLVGKHVIYYRMRQVTPARIYEKVLRNYWNLDARK